MFLLKSLFPGLFLTTEISLHKRGHANNRNNAEKIGDSSNWIFVIYF